MTFQESDLTFNFSDDDWEVIRYDTHRYYKTLSGVGLKGVDFLGIYKKEQVVFFEVKHFRSPQFINSTSYPILEDPDTFTNRITGKLNDTIKAIRVIVQYFERKPWYRLYLRYNYLIPSFFIKNKDWYFWYRLHLLTQQKELITFVLWLEIESKNNVYSIENTPILLGEELKNNLLSIIGKVKIVDRKNPAFKASLIVN